MLEIVYINFYGYTLYNQSFYITAINMQLKNDKLSFTNSQFWMNFSYISFYL